jgi:CheY-like chemotaxis protein/AraC-like DNA-binding protein/signal transduction histidine kinase
MKPIAYLHICMMLLCSFSLSAQPHYILSHASGLPSGNVLCAAHSYDGSAWIGTESGLSRFNGISVSTYYTADGLVSNKILSLSETADTVLWIGTDAGISRLHLRQNSFLRGISLPASIGGAALSIEADSRGAVWVKSSGGIAKYNTNGELQQLYAPGHSFHDELDCGSPSALAVDFHGNLWVACRGQGLGFFNVQQGRFLALSQPVPKSRNTPRGNSINQLHSDKNGDLWIADNSKGLIRRRHIDGHEKLFAPGGTGCSFLAADNSGIIWAYFHGQGLYYNHPGQDSIIKFQLRQNNEPVTALSTNSYGMLLVGTRAGAEIYTSPPASIFSPVMHTGSPARLIAPAEGNFIWAEAGGTAVFAELKHAAGRYYASAIGKPVSLSRFTQVAGAPGSRLWALAADSSLYIISAEGETKLVTKMLSAQPIIQGGQSSTIYLIAQGRNVSVIDFSAGAPVLSHSSSIDFTPRAISRAGKNILLLSDTALWIWNPDKQKPDFLQNTSAFGAPASIAACPLGDLLVASPKGLFHVAAAGVYGSNKLINGRPCRLVSYAETGKAYAIFDNGLHVVDIARASAQPVLLSGLPQAGRQAEKLELAASGLVLAYGQQGLMAAQQANIIPVQNPLSIEYAAIRDKQSLGTGASNNIVVKRKRSSSALISIAEYSGAGASYGIYIKSNNNEYLHPIGKEIPLPENISNTELGIGLGKGLEIEIMPAFPWTAAAAAGIALALLAFIGMSNRKRIISYASRLRNSYVSERQVRDMYQAKLNFFTEISHEIRTPLTMIIDPIDQILRRENLSPFAKDKLRIVLENGDKILALLNKLLDYRKLESKSDKLAAQELDLREFIDAAASRYSDMAIQRSQEIKLSLGEAPALAWADRTKLPKIFDALIESVLISLPEGQAISITLTEPKALKKGKEADSLEINILDAAMYGLGLGKTFPIRDLFTAPGSSDPQSSPGLGILVANKLAQLHKASLQAYTLPGGSLGFRLSFKRGSAHLAPAEIAASSAAGAEPIDYDEEAAASEKKSVLLAEDNPNVLAYLDTIFSSNYIVYKAFDGAQAWEMAQRYVPDIIISDVMMPEMDGNELCANIKANYATSHIPVLLLTAKTFAEDQIAGLEAGADDYIPKPFKSEVLELKVKNILATADRMRRQLKTDLLLKPTEQIIESEEDKLMKRLIDFIDRNLSDMDITVDSIAMSMGISRAQLFRKTKAILGQTPNDLLKTMRLKKAEQLVRQGKLRIGDIAFEVGFPNPQYFSQSFAKMYGCTPSDYHKKHTS